MNLPGLLIEYLINGSLALLWIGRLFLMVNPEILAFTGNEILFLPMIYVIGMFIDYIAWFVTKPFKKMIRADALSVVHKEINDDSFQKKDFELFWQEKLEIEKQFPELNKELSSRSSRDRIARGTMLNLIPITILYWPMIHVLGIILFIISIFMWKRFEHYNHCFELRAAYSVREANRKKEEELEKEKVKLSIEETN